MTAILTRAGCFAAIILMGYVLRRAGFFKKEDFHVLSKIVIKITLTCAIITNFAGRELDVSMLFMTLIGFLFGVVLIVTAVLLNRRQGRMKQAFAVVNSSGVNIGNFVLPFAQNFLGPVSVMAVSLFDVGNSLICLGGSYAVGEMVQEGGRRFSFRPLLRAVRSSVPLFTYLIMTALCLLHIRLPAPVLEFAGIVGNANAFMAMLMIGVGFNIGANREQLLGVLRTLGPRYLIGLALSLLSWFVLPFPPEWRKALAILFLGPVASAAPAFTAQLKNDYGLASAINSFSILISILLIVGALVLIA